VKLCEAAISTHTPGGVSADKAIGGCKRAGRWSNTGEGRKLCSHLSPCFCPTASRTARETAASSGSTLSDCGAVAVRTARLHAKGLSSVSRGQCFKTSSGRHRKVGPSAERRDVPESTLPGCAKHLRWEASVIGRAQRDVHQALEQSTGASVLLRRYFELKRGEPCAAT
jgi:hypothetical protein